ncbi:uncharacterized protein LOC103317650 [Nasonia vitripennis]|uniref:Uncharacterized protein n=1 Tax=Nasonia vitripennis TaxID=7425 RepID=A0A7M7H8Z2_NASVI|nr:uncharacterized protein LOC103317650 [Nasonia vitripennis]
MLTKFLVILLSALALARAAPATTYDQRQDGDLNVKVDLDNFIILVARPSSSMDVFGSLAELFADVKRASPSAQVMGLGGAQQSEPEGKTSPAARDELKLDKSKELADVTLDEQQPKEPEKPEEEMFLLVQEGDKAARSLEDVVRTLRNLKGKGALLERDVIGKDKSKVVKYKFIETADDPLSLKLIGDAVENCGPGRSRDRSGICQAHN